MWTFYSLYMNLTIAIFTQLSLNASTSFFLEKRFICFITIKIEKAIIIKSRILFMKD